MSVRVHVISFRRAHSHGVQWGMNWLFALSFGLVCLEKQVPFSSFTKVSFGLNVTLQECLKSQTKQDAVKIRTNIDVETVSISLPLGLGGLCQDRFPRRAICMFVQHLHSEGPCLWLNAGLPPS